MALLNAPVAEKVSEVAKEGEDAIPHVGQHGHQEWSLLIVLQKWLLVQAAVARRNILVLEGSKVQSICRVTSATSHMWQCSGQTSTYQTTYAFIQLIKQSCFRSQTVRLGRCSSGPLPVVVQGTLELVIHTLKKKRKTCSGALTMIILQHLH